MRHLAAAIITIALATIVTNGVVAQDPPSRAFLDVGPVRRSGIDALAPDVTPHWYAAYRIGAAVVELMYMTEPLPVAEDWPPAPCVDRSLRSADGTHYYHRHADGWSLLVAVRSGELPEGVALCRFVDRFIVQHLAFERLEAVQRPPDEPILPAVIEL